MGNDIIRNIKSNLSDPESTGRIKQTYCNNSRTIFPDSSN